MINLYNGSEPIINPWLFYLADLVSALKVTLIILSIGLVIGSLLYLVAWYENEEYRSDSEKTLNLEKCGSKALRCAL